MYPANSAVTPYDPKFHRSIGRSTKRSRMLVLDHRPVGFVYMCQQELM
jgi:hypothetical protein